MNFCSYFILFFSVISAINLLVCALSLHVEAIHGGTVADPQLFDYQVGILVQKNGSHLYALIGNGGIIAKNLILSAAMCFVNNDGILMNFEYSITFGTINWQLVSGLIIPVDKIYLHGVGEYYLDNVAVVKIVESLDNYPVLSFGILRVPFPDESFFKQQSVVSGYGYSWVRLNQTNTSRARRRVSAGSDHFLRFAKVMITHKSMCAKGYRAINRDKQFCGVMLTDQEWQLWGICDKDAGSPLVIENTIVGLATFNHEECDDTVIGSAYSKVSFYAQFIYSVIREKQLPDTVVYQNRIHHQFLVAPAA